MGIEYNQANKQNPIRKKKEKIAQRKWDKQKQKIKMVENIYIVSYIKMSINIIYTITTININGQNLQVKRKKLLNPIFKVFIGFFRRHT